METIKIQHLYIYTGFSFLCEVLLTLGSFNSLTLTLGVAKAQPLSRGFLLGFQVSL